jgi:hypothetical protein
MKVTRFKLLFPQSIFSIFEFIEISLFVESDLESHHRIKLRILNTAGRKVFGKKCRATRADCQSHAASRKWRRLETEQESSAEHYQVVEQYPVPVSDLLEYGPRWIPCFRIKLLWDPVPELIDPVFSHRKRAFWACFRENWVYKFGHSSAICWTRWVRFYGQNLDMSIKNVCLNFSLQIYFRRAMTVRHCENWRFSLVDWKHLMAAKWGEIDERFIFQFPSVWIEI